jgi:hypothetical protein
MRVFYFAGIFLLAGLTGVVNWRRRMYGRVRRFGRAGGYRRYNRFKRFRWAGFLFGNHACGDAHFIFKDKGAKSMINSVSNNQAPLWASVNNNTQGKSQGDNFSTTAMNNDNCRHFQLDGNALVSAAVRLPGGGLC